MSDGGHVWLLEHRGAVLEVGFPWPRRLRWDVSEELWKGSSAVDFTGGSETGVNGVRGDAGYAAWTSDLGAAPR